MMGLVELWNIRDGRPRVAMWLKWHYTYTVSVPFIGSWLWRWANARVERWHERRSR